jgi:Fe-Mn family superoxide dismutase
MFSTPAAQPPKENNSMAFTLTPLPYDKNALAPHISAETLEFHYGKHHQAYVTNLNKLLEGKPEASKSLEEVILASEGGVFNNAAQVWNHTFFWSCLDKEGGGEPEGDLKKAIAHDFGGVDKFAKEFKEAATTQFGSGWAWLVFDAGKLKIIKTANAVNPIAGGQTALATCDVWEHAYYLDYQNRRPDFVQAFLDNLINWDFIAENFAKAMEKAV